MAGDFNEALSESSSISKIASAHGLIDILFQRNAHLPEPPTYIQGSTRIDYVLTTPDLAEAVKAGDMSLSTSECTLTIEASSSTSTQI